MEEKKTCTYESRKYWGLCFNDIKCSEVCIKEGFIGGDCQGVRRRCMCYNHCSNWWSSISIYHLVYIYIYVLHALHKYITSRVIYDYIYQPVLYMQWLMMNKFGDLKDSSTIDHYFWIKVYIYISIYSYKNLVPTHLIFFFFLQE